MLLQFAVENFLSIKDEVVLNLSATTDRMLCENTVSYGGKKKYLRSVGIYGANASGKSNLMKALLTAVMLIRASNNRMINTPLNEIVPFKFDKNTMEQPSTFKFLFVVNGVKYYYAFSANQKAIIEECLYQYKTAKPSNIFERTNINVYKFPQTDKTVLEGLKDKNTDNKLFLATATNWNYDKTRDAFMWFMEGIDIILDYLGIQNGDVLNAFRDDENNELKNFTLQILQEADININHIGIDISDEKITEFNVPPELYQKLKLSGSTEGTIHKYKIHTGHEITTEHKTRQIELLLEEESLGTQTLFFLSPILKKVFDRGKTLCIDEMEMHLHPLLVEFIIHLFHKPSLNKNGAQLIFTTHNIHFMSLDLLRRDQLFFVDKNKQTGATELYSLDEFSVRKNENIRKAYLAGRFGAVPNIGLGG